MDNEEDTNWLVWDQPYLNFNHRCDYYQEQVQKHKKEQANTIGFCLVVCFAALFSFFSTFMSHHLWLFLLIVPTYLPCAYLGYKALDNVRFGLRDFQDAFTETHEYLDTLNGRNF